MHFRKRKVVLWYCGFPVWCWGWVKGVVGEKGWGKDYRQLQRDSEAPVDFCIYYALRLDGGDGPVLRWRCWWEEW
jgi:hypothetical protein